MTQAVTIIPCQVLDLANSREFAELHAEYAAESSIPELGTAAMQVETYRALEQSGTLRIIGAFYGEAIVGFLTMLVAVLPHYGAKVASTESFFVAHAARKTGAGLKLLQEAERIAREDGAIGFFVSAPNGGRLAEVLDAHKAYRETNRVFFRGFS